MGYACPVCDAAQPDAEHLANHLAFTAMLRHDDHESWLDANAPGWGAVDPESLGERLAEQVPETEFEGPATDAATGGRPDPPREPGGHDPTRALDPSDRAVLREARELTRQMMDDAESTAGGDAGPADGESDRPTAGEDAEPTDAGDDGKDS